DRIFGLFGDRGSLQSVIADFAIFRIILGEPTFSKSECFSESLRGVSAPFDSILSTDFGDSNILEYAIVLASFGMRRLSFGLMEDSNTLVESRMGISIFGGSISRSPNIDIPGISSLCRTPSVSNDSMVTVSFPSCDCFTRVTVCAFKEPSATEAESDVFEYVQTSVSFTSSSVFFTMILGTFCICVANFRSFSNLAASDMISASEMEIASAVSFKCSNSDSAFAAVYWLLHSFLQYLDDLLICFFSIDYIHIILSIGSCSSFFNILYKNCFLRIIINFIANTETSLSSQSSTSFVYSFASSIIGQLSFTSPVFGVSFSLTVVELSCFSISATVDILDSISVFSLFSSVLSVNSIVDIVDKFHWKIDVLILFLQLYPFLFQSISVFFETLCSMVIDDSACVLLSQARSDISCCISWMLPVHFSDTILHSALGISILSMLVIQTVLEVGLGIVEELHCVTGFKLSNCKVGSSFDSVIICERAAISLSRVESPICSPDCTPMISLISIMLRVSVSYVSVSLSTPYGA
ncbi:hypothetical protein ALC60_02718, partial [Trachymyrmex zeteki]